MAEDNLSKLTELARNAPPPSAEERERQRRSFAFGNANIENKNVTRDKIEMAALSLDKDQE